ncbi:hypothetical protein V12B01_12130 [Vibrio splendidus 12B01]|nr:hypothetical protein V12B01_12130 [Vibrio splendidus 12B01]
MFVSRIDMVTNRNQMQKIATVKQKRFIGLMREELIYE